MKHLLTGSSAPACRSLVLGTLISVQYAIIFEPSEKLTKPHHGQTVRQGVCWELLIVIRQRRLRNDVPRVK